jgi:hypothetical protein
MNCHNIVYDEITLDMMHKIETMKDTEEKSCKLFCNMDKASCNSFHFDRNLRECMLFRLKLVEFQLKAKLIGAPKGCGASFPPCVSTEQLKIESFFCTAHLLFPNNDSRDPVFLHMHIKENSCVFIFFVFVCRIMYLIFFLLDFGLSWLTSLQFIQYHVAGFYKPTIPQSPPSHLWNYSTCNNARLEFSTIFVPSFDPNEWCLKNGLHSGGLTSRS